MIARKRYTGKCYTVISYSTKLLQIRYLTLPGILSSLSTWPSMASVVHVMTGPMVSFFMLRFAASFFNSPSNPEHQQARSVPFYKGRLELWPNLRQQCTSSLSSLSNRFRVKRSAPFVAVRQRWQEWLVMRRVFDTAHLTITTYCGKSTIQYNSNACQLWLAACGASLCLRGPLFAEQNLSSHHPSRWACWDA